MSVGCFFSFFTKPSKRASSLNIRACLVITLFLFTSSAHAQFRMVETGGTFTEYVALQAPASVATNFTWTMPGADGSPNQCLATNGSGTLFWHTPGGSSNSLNASDGSPTNAVFVDASGNVGIGTTSPGRLLHVTAPIRLSPTAAPGSPAAGDIFVDSGDFNRLKIYDGSGWIAASNDFNTYLYNTTPYTASGGSVTPGVAGNFMYNTNGATGMGAVFTIGARNATTYQNSYFGAVSNASGFAPSIVIGQQTGASSYEERLRIDESGNVGVGTTTIFYKFQVNGGASAWTYNSGYGTPGSPSFNLSGGAGMYGPNSGGDVGLATSGLERLRITSTGRVGIGTTNPQAGLDVAMTGTSASAIIVPRDTTANRPTTAVNGMIRYNSTTAKFEGYENGGWVPLSSGLVGSLRYAGTANCDWTNPSSGSWVNFAADTDCANATVTGGATAPGTKIPGIVTNNLPAGDYEVTVVTQFRMTAGAGNSCRYRISDGTNTSGLLVTSSDQVDQSSTVGLFSYASAGSRTFQIQAIATSNNICHVYADEPGTVEFVIWVKRI